MTALASDTAMVMAAGLGKRMRPLTATQPKPLKDEDGVVVVPDGTTSLQIVATGAAGVMPAWTLTPT